MKSIHIEIPCSSANLGPGLDVLAVALDLYLILDVQFNSDSALNFQIQYLGNHGASCDPSSNLIVTTMQRFHFLTSGKLCMQVQNHIPLARGLGSSAAAIVAGVILANWLGQFRWSRQDMLSKCLLIETHPDNLSAALFGGLVVSCSGSPGITLSLPFNTSLFRLAVIIPNYKGFTKELRSALPTTYPFKDVVYSMQRVTLLTHLLGNPSANIPHDQITLVNLLNDVLHQPYRSPYLPGYQELKKLILQDTLFSSNVLGLCLSGSGPSLLLFLPAQLDDLALTALEDTLKDLYKKIPHPTLANQGIDVQVLHLSPSHGAQWMEQPAFAHAV